MILTRLMDVFVGDTLRKSELMGYRKCLLVSSSGYFQNGENEYTDKPRVFAWPDCDHGDKSFACWAVTGCLSVQHSTVRTNRAPSRIRAFFSFPSSYEQPPRVFQTAVIGGLARHLR